MTDEYESIDLELEKLVFLFNAGEGNPGIYELTWELGYYNLSIEDKYKVAHELLTILLKDELITLDKYTDTTLKNKMETIPLDRSQVILNNPSFWYPCDEIFSITLTEKGDKYLNENVLLYGDRFTERMLGKKR